MSVLDIECPYPVNLELAMVVLLLKGLLGLL